MMTTDILLALTAFALVASITPGPNNLMLMTSGTNFGFRRTIPHMAGVTIGFTAMIAIVGAGLRQVFDLFPFAYTILKWVSVVYLVYLSFKIAWASVPGQDGEPFAAESKPLSFIQAALFQWINPKAWTLALTACAAYVPKEHPVAGLGFVVIIFAIVNMPTVIIWAYLGVQIRRLLDKPARLRMFNISAALLLLASIYPVVF